MGNTLASFFNRFAFSRRESAADENDAPEWGQVDYDEDEFNDEYSDDELLLTDDDSWSDLDSFHTTDDSSDDDGLVTEGMGDRALEAEPEAEAVEEQEDRLDQNEVVSVREGGSCLVVERQQLHGLEERLAGGKMVCVCGVVCASYKNHRRHVEYASGKGKFGCAYCPKVFMYLGYLNQHQRQAHDLLPHGGQDGKTYACRDCTLEFCSMSRLLLHRRAEHDYSGQSADSDHSGEQPLRPDSSTAGHKRKLSARRAAKGQGPKKRVKTLPGIQQEEEEPSSSNQSCPPRAPEPKRSCSFCNKNLRGWSKDSMMKNWKNFDFCCHETVHAWIMKD